MTSRESRTHRIDRVSPALTKLYCYWCEKAGRRLYPPRHDLDPTDIPSLLPHVMLVEVTDEGRYRYRLAGTRVVSTVGMELAGRYVDDVHVDHYCDDVVAIYDAVLLTGRPHYSILDFLNDKQQVKKIAERVVLPLGEDRVTLFLAGQRTHYAKNNLPSALLDHDTLGFAKPIPLSCPDRTDRCATEECLFRRGDVDGHDRARPRIGDD